MPLGLSAVRGFGSGGTPAALSWVFSGLWCGMSDGNCLPLLNFSLFPGAATGYRSSKRNEDDSHPHRYRSGMQ